MKQPLGNLPQVAIVKGIPRCLRSRSVRLLQVPSLRRTRNESGLRNTQGQVQRPVVSSDHRAFAFGSDGERLLHLVLKTSEPNGSAGSTPAASAVGVWPGGQSWSRWQVAMLPSLLKRQ